MSLPGNEGSVDLVTGVIGFCPLCRILGINTCPAWKAR